MSFASSLIPCLYHHLDHRDHHQYRPRFRFHCSMSLRTNLSHHGGDCPASPFVPSIVFRIPPCSSVSFSGLSTVRSEPDFRLHKFKRGPDHLLVLVHDNLKEEPDEEYGKKGDSELQSSLGNIGGLVPINLITLATPHLGVRGRNQLPFLFGLPILERLAASLAPILVGRTGRQLFLTDENPDKPPLILRTASDCRDMKFVSSLASFRNRILYANVSYDQAEKRKEAAQTASNTQTPEEYYELMEEETIRGLQRIGWKKVDVSFHSATWPFFSHNSINVKNEWLYSAGAGVIAHAADYVKQQQEQ